MKSFDSRTYSINDFVEWDAQKALELNPFFQRRPVWSPKAKSYLMDTIFRGKPIPKIFIRQKLNVTTRTSVREVVDGQQRLRTILSFIGDGFTVSPRQNREFGGLLFSQLAPEIQEQILAYEVSVDLLVNMPDAEILDIFSRLNSYAVVLNEQEKINATNFGSFKILADDVGRRYYEYWTNQGILTYRNILRMQEVNLVADLLIAMREGIKSKKQIRKFYEEYERSFDDDVDEWTRKFDEVIVKIGLLYPEGLKTTEFCRNHLFYSLFTAVAHCLHGLPKLVDEPRIDLNSGPAIERARNGLERVSEIFEAPDLTVLARNEQEFIQDSRRATTDEVVRQRRTKYLLGLMG